MVLIGIMVYALLLKEFIGDYTIAEMCL